MALTTNALAVEPKWLKVRTIQMPGTHPKRRVIHFTDLHYKGDAAYLKSVVGRINSLAPELVFFTGDIIEDAVFLEPALKILGKIEAPLFGVPGNHDHWSHADFTPIRECFGKTGGAWLVNQAVDLPNLGIRLSAIDRLPASLPPVPGKKNIMLIHYPEWAEKLDGHRYDLILAGHSHGGQVRIPFYGALIVPFSTGKYEVGMFQTAAGPLYVNPGIGYFYVNARFNCRPEITVFEI